MSLMEYEDGLFVAATVLPKAPHDGDHSSNVDSIWRPRTMEELKEISDKLSMKITVILGKNHLLT